MRICVVAAKYLRHPCGLSKLVKAGTIMYLEIAQAWLGTQLISPKMCVQEGG